MRKNDGTRFKGRKCCTKRGVDPDFMEAHNDLHNLLPAGGELNGGGLNHPFGEVDGEPRVPERTPARFATVFTAMRGASV